MPEPRPYLSVVVPALNEASCIGPSIDRLRAVLDGLVPSWEILIVDDGSTDGTRAIVDAQARADGRVRLLAGPHAGKGAAIRRGILAAAGEWRFMADADLAMPPENLARFLAVARRPGPPPIIIGSREAPGAERVGESAFRHVVGRVFNWLVRLVAVRGVRDTQCGFKLFSAEAAQQVFPRATITGFAFDVEVLHLARQAGLAIEEVGIVWHGRADSRVGLGRGASAFSDIVRIRLRHGAAVPRRSSPAAGHAGPPAGG